jgi:C-terminal processing protease CtpA/Prc
MDSTISPSVTALEKKVNARSSAKYPVTNMRSIDRERKYRGVCRKTFATLLLSGWLAASGCSSEECELPDLPEPASTTAGRRRQDLQYLAEALTRCHVRPFGKTPEPVFRQAVADLDQAMGSLTEAQAVVGLARVVALLGDGHTALSLRPDNTRFRRLPLRLYWFPDGLYVTDATAAHPAARGLRVARIGDRTPAEADRGVGELISQDNAAAVLDQSPDYLTLGEVLAALGMADSPTRVGLILEGERGAPTTLDVDAVAEEASLRWLSTSDPSPPLARQRNDQNYWYAYLAAERTLYLQYNRCREAADAPMAAFAREALAALDRGPAERVVVDLRRNTGGDSRVLRPFIDGLAARPTLLQRGRVFVVVGRHTYSSAVINALELRDETHALLVGEQTGGAPNGAGEVRSFRLPNSGLRVTYSTKYFTLVSGPGDALRPDLEVQESAADHFAGVDPALTAILAYRP